VFCTLLMVPRTKLWGMRVSDGAADGNRTHVLSLGSSGPAIERQPRTSGTATTFVESHPRLARVSPVRCALKSAGTSTKPASHPLNDSRALLELLQPAWNRTRVRHPRQRPELILSNQWFASTRWRRARRTHLLALQRIAQRGGRWWRGGCRRAGGSGSRFALALSRLRRRRNLHAQWQRV
jgi:hypothetical protein